MAQTEGYSLEAQVERLREYAEYRDLRCHPTSPEMPVFP